MSGDEERTTEQDDRDGQESPEFEARLRRLEVASREREAQLLELADRVPAAVSRTATLRSMLTDLGGVFRRRRS